MQIVTTEQSHKSNWLVVRGLSGGMNNWGHSSGLGLESIMNNRDSAVGLLDWRSFKRC
jgi:hypothetical protein